VTQVARPDESWKAGALAGGYWLRAPAQGAEAALIYSGALAPEALAAWEALKDDVPGLGLLAVTSPDLLHRGWSARQASRWSKNPPRDGDEQARHAPGMAADVRGTPSPAHDHAKHGGGGPAHVEALLAPLAPGAGLVTLLDGAPASLSWLGGVHGHRVAPLGVDRFGQTGNLQDLYREYRLDVDAVVEAAAELFLR
jgi:pyruvate dehydrogenase E1 component